jgi:DNA polymerase
VHSAEQGGWLILLEPAANPPLLSPAQRPAADSAQTALQGDAAKLLDNMLRALGLQENRVSSAPHCTARRPMPTSAMPRRCNPPWRPCCASCARTACWFWAWPVHAPCWAAMIALGRLRAEPHHIAGVPTVVTYDPNYLLRAPQAKAGAWADLVQADAFTKGL